MNSTIRSTSPSVTKQPCTRVGLEAPMGEKSMSPRPNSFSAPLASRMVRESICEETAKAMREGMLALMTPVMTSTEGRWVAMTRCMPAARAICARRQIESSTSPGAAIIRSASSSMMMTICGIGFRPFFSAARLKPAISRTL